jgi:hypothetical protein
VWTPDVTGNYLIKAAVDATSTYRATNKVVTLALTPDQESNSIFTLNSNSTITQLSFDSESNELSFTASGPSNSHGYVEVYIPKTLIADITNLKTYIDGTPVSFNSQDQTDSWLITLTYSHSQHHITLQLSNNGQTPVQPPSSNWLTDNIILIAIAGVAIIIATAMTLAFKRSKPQK